MASLKVKRKKGEDSFSLIKRFTSAVVRSGILLEKRKKMYKERSRSENLKRDSKLYRLEKEKEYQKLKKLGQL